jgi:hypothetical protein
MNLPHEVTVPRSEVSRNDTRVFEVDIINISSTNGILLMAIARSNLTNQLGFAESIGAIDSDIWQRDTPINTIEVDNSTGWYMINYANGIPIYAIFYYIQNPSGADFVSAPTGTKTTVCCTIISILPLYNTADFLRSLHIKPLRYE